ncbi:MAG: hypothetical protein NXI20_21390 [bacterium]|nr:hypothetical protein [bacterium]
MKKNFIIITLSFAMTSLLIFVWLQNLEANKLRAETEFLSEQVKNLKDRSDKLAEKAALEAARATQSNAETNSVLEELRRLELQLDRCK